MSKYDNEKLRFNFGKCCIKLGKVDMAEQNLKDNEYLKISDNIIEVAKLYEEAEQLKLALQYYKYLYQVLLHSTAYLQQYPHIKSIP